MMYVADRDTFCDAFCGDCGRIAEGSDIRKYQGICEECFIQAVEKDLVQGMQQVFEETKAEIQASLDDDWQQIKDIVEGKDTPSPTELPDGDVMLHCQYCEKRTQHTETEKLPGGYPLYECVICDGGRIK